MVHRVVRFLWGDISSEDLKKYGILAFVITLILGNYWMLRVLKDGIFNEFVGLEWLTRMKPVSVVVATIMLLFYSKLVDIFKKHQLFYILCSFYGVLFLFIGYAISHPDMFSLSVHSSWYPYVSWLPGKLIGWIAYLAIESSNLLMFMFWGFVASITIPEKAKTVFPMMLFCAQLGTVTSTTVANMFVRSIGTATFVFIGGLIAFIVPCIIKWFVTIIPQEEAFVEKRKEKSGFFGGLKLILTKPYVMGIFVVSTVYEIVGFFLEFQLKMIGRGFFPSMDSFNAFIAKYGIGVNVLSLLFTLLGTSFFMRKFGLRFCLMVYPAIIGVVVITVFSVSIFGISSLVLMWILWGSMIALKGFSYALNNPTKETMYIPTGRDVRFKAKTWIESFGGRGMKAAGGIIADPFKASLPALLTFGSIISFGIVVVWLCVAHLLGTKFNRLQEENKIIE
jgi:ATP:ADP antiporter, AAA family